MKFIRRVPDRDHVLVDADRYRIAVNKAAFKCGSKDQQGPPEKQGLSWMKMSNDMEQDQCLAYWKHCESRGSSVVRPALFWMSGAEINQAMGQQPRYSKDDEDQVYGHLHHLTDCPCEDQRSQLAKKAQEAKEMRLLQPHIHPRKPQKPSDDFIAQTLKL